MDPERARELLAGVPGFGRCNAVVDGREVACKYLDWGTPALCLSCARMEIFELVGPNRCPVCDQMFTDGQTRCSNWLCGPVGGQDRYFERNYAIARREGILEGLINKYKVGQRWGWSRIFGRILVGFLEEQADTFDGFDLIVASPTWTGTGGRDRDHTRLVLEHAELAAPGRWPLDLDVPAVVVKTRATTRMRGQSGTRREEIAENELGPALSIPDPSLTRGRAILVYDDVFVGGRTLNQVARALIDLGGASRVSGVSLSREPQSRA